MPIEMTQALLFVEKEKYRGSFHEHARRAMATVSRLAITPL